MKNSSQIQFWCTALIVCSALVAGCGEEEAPQVSQEEVELIPEMPSSALEVKPVSFRTTSAPQIVLKTGEQYYYEKTIEQKLGIEPGNPIGRVWERVDFLFSLTVREEIPGGYLVDVVFHKVRYQSERGENHLLYDSRSRSPVPSEVVPYRRMVDRGFSLQIDRSNRITDVAGFDQFLLECFAEYPSELRHELLLSMGGFSTEPGERIDAASGFLDESFALLPFGEVRESGDAFSIGSHWTRHYSRANPVPVRQTIEASLQNISGEGEWGQVVIKGTLSPSPPETTATAVSRAGRVTGGTITGSCSVSLTTGLPKTCRIQKELSMDLASQVPGQPATPVSKTIVTSLKPWQPPAADGE